MSHPLHQIRRAAYAAVALAAFAFTPAQSSSEATPNDMARFLAGLPAPEGAPMAVYNKHPSWAAHQRAMDATWRSLQQRQLPRIAAFSKANLAVRQPTTFYMFSGPDFLYANAFFPGSKTYVMSGLEPVGRIPEGKFVNARNVGALTGHLQSSIGAITRVSFFLTKQMSYQLRATQLNGTMPILFTFLARADKTITNVSFLTVDAEGKAKESDGTPLPNTPNGVKISFKGEGGEEQTLYYFSTDVSNGGVKSTGFLKFCESLGPGDAFVKSASYLMHSDSFSTVREFLLANANTILQDDTGVPVRYFKRDDWDLRPYGRYLGPIPLFGRNYQKDLAELFRKGNATPIDFGAGYRWLPNESNLMIASKQQRKAALDGK